MASATRAIGFAALALVATAAGAQTRPGAETAAVAGAYHLSTEDGTKMCIILLRNAPTPGGLALGFLPHCKNTIPVLVPIAAWTLEVQPGEPRGRIRLHDVQGGTVLDFSTPGPRDTVAAREGTFTYHLKPGDGRSIAVKIDGVKPARAAPARPAVAVATAPPSPADTRTSADLAGVYALQRARGAATGCSLTLDISAKATLKPGCKDAGATFFSPQGWNVSGGTLWLTNSRGQKLSFERNRTGSWDKGPGQGEPLSLVRQP